MVLDASAEALRTVAHDLNTRSRNSGSPVAGADRHPHKGWDTVRQFVEGERGAETDHAIGNELGGFRERMVRIEGSIGQLIEAAAQLDQRTLLLHAGYCRRRDVLLEEFGQTHHAALSKESSSAILLAGRWCRHGSS